MVKITVFKGNLFTLGEYLVLQYFNYAGIEYFSEPFGLDQCSYAGIEIHQTLVFDAGEKCDDG